MREMSSEGESDSCDDATSASESKVKTCTDIREDSLTYSCKWHFKRVHEGKVQSLGGLIRSAHDELANLAFQKVVQGSSFY
jgi:hypothetical protein